MVSIRSEPALTPHTARFRGWEHARSSKPSSPIRWPPRTRPSEMGSQWRAKMALDVLLDVLNSITVNSLPFCMSHKNLPRSSKTVLSRPYNKTRTIFKSNTFFVIAVFLHSSLYISLIKYFHRKTNCLIIRFKLCCPQRLLTF